MKMLRRMNTLRLNIMRACQNNQNFLHCFGNSVACWIRTGCFLLYWAQSKTCDAICWNPSFFSNFSNMSNNLIKVAQWMPHTPPLIWCSQTRLSRKLLPRTLLHCAKRWPPSLQAIEQEGKEVMLCVVCKRFCKAPENLFTSLCDGFSMDDTTRNGIYWFQFLGASDITKTSKACCDGKKQKLLIANSSRTREWHIWFYVYYWIATILRTVILFSSPISWGV